LSVIGEVTAAKFGDFFVNGQYTFEIGGATKTAKQIQGVPLSYIAADGIKNGVNNKIPLWLLAFYINQHSTLNPQPSLLNIQPMNLTGTHINYYRLCKRKLWFFANGINMEQTSDLVADGKLIEEGTYLQHRNDMSKLNSVASFKGFHWQGKLISSTHETKSSTKPNAAIK
jgi:hypothetical protein